MNRKQKLTAAAYFAAIEGVGAAVSTAVIFETANVIGIFAGFCVGAALLGSITYGALSLITRRYGI